MGQSYGVTLSWDVWATRVFSYVYLIVFHVGIWYYLLKQARKRCLGREGITFIVCVTEDWILIIWYWRIHVLHALKVLMLKILNAGIIVVRWHMCTRKSKILVQRACISQFTNEHPVIKESISLLQRMSISLLRRSQQEYLVTGRRMRRHEALTPHTFMFIKQLHHTVQWHYYCELQFLLFPSRAGKCFM